MLKLSGLSLCDMKHFIPSIGVFNFAENMKIGLLYISIFSLLFLSYTDALAEKTPEDPDERVSRQSERCIGAGNTLVLTGAGFAMTGIAMIVEESIHARNSVTPPSGLQSFIGMITAGLGGVLAIVGTPLWISGSVIQRRYSVSSLEFRGPSQKGGTVIIDLGIFLFLDPKAGITGGYHFSENLFIGGGISFSALDRENMYVPIYADMRYTIGDRKCSPYLSLNLGYDIYAKRPYGEFSLGSRIRSRDTSRKSSWWAGGTIIGEYNPFCRDDCFLRYGFKASYSF